MRAVRGEFSSCGPLSPRSAWRVPFRAARALPLLPRSLLTPSRSLATPPILTPISLSIASPPFSMFGFARRSSAAGAVARVEGRDTRAGAPALAVAAPAPAPASLVSIQERAIRLRNLGRELHVSAQELAFRELREAEMRTLGAAVTALQVARVFEDVVPIVGKLLVAADYYERVQEWASTSLVSEVVWRIPESTYVHLMLECPSMPGCDCWVAEPFVGDLVPSSRVCPFCVGVLMLRPARRGKTRFPTELSLEDYTARLNGVTGVRYDDIHKCAHLLSPCPDLDRNTPDVVSVRELVERGESVIPICARCRDRVLTMTLWEEIGDCVGLVRGVRLP